MNVEKIIHLFKIIFYRLTVRGIVFVSEQTIE